MKRLLALITIGILLGSLWGCSTKKDKDEPANQDSESSESDLDYDLIDKGHELFTNYPEDIFIKDANMVKWTDDYSLPAPRPYSDEIVPWDFGVFCRISQEKLEKYQLILQEDGWLLTEKTIWNDFPHYTYMKDDMLFQLIDHTLVDSYDDSYILVNLSYGYVKYSQREKTISRDAAAQLIQEHIDRNKDQMGYYGKQTGSIVTMVVEQYIEDSYEMMGLQVFTAINQKGNTIGNYLVRDGLVYYFQDSLEEICVVDIDEDGTFELLSLFGWGSGIYRLELKAYKLANPDFLSSLTKMLTISYYNTFVPKNGYGHLSLNRISNTDVRLIDHELDSEGKETKLVDYGKIILAEDGIHLIPTLLEDFPYDQWDYSYNQDNIIETAEENAIKNSLKEPPEIGITVNDTTLNYKVRKTVWGEEEPQDRISFSDIFNEQEAIPEFDNPGRLYQYNYLIYLDFGDITPDQITVKDYLLRETGDIMYDPKLAMDREVKIEEKGLYSFGISQHFAMMLSSSTATYTNPSYRGFVVICTLAEDKVCEYSFVLCVGPYR